MAVRQPLPFEVREPYEWKLSSTVLRGERGREAPDLPGFAIVNYNEIIAAADEKRKIARKRKHAAIQAAKTRIVGISDWWII